MKIEVAITFDVEADCPGIVNSYRGVQKGLPKLLTLLRDFRLQATFFITGKTAEKFPSLCHTLAANHEVACHGLSHKSMNISSEEQIIELQTAKNILQEISGQRVEGFRAPRLQLNDALFSNLARTGYRYDSSIAWWIPQHRQFKPSTAGIDEFPLLLPNVLLRFPTGLQLFQGASLFKKSLIVLYFHPSESIPMGPLFQREGVRTKSLLWRPDRWINTGPTFFARLRELLRFLLRRKAIFAPIRTYCS